MLKRNYGISFKIKIWLDTNFAANTVLANSLTYLPQPLRIKEGWSNLSGILEIISPIRTFLQERLNLTLHPQKMYLRTLASGMDFLGWVHFPYYRVLRTATKRRMIQRIANHPIPETLQSYLGLLRHGDAYILRENILNNYWLKMG